MSQRPGIKYPPLQFTLSALRGYLADLLDPIEIYVVAFQDYRLIWLELARSNVHHGHVIQNQQVGCCRFLRARRATCQQQRES